MHRYEACLFMDGPPRFERLVFVLAPHMHRTKSRRLPVVVAPAPPARFADPHAGERLQSVQDPAVRRDSSIGHQGERFVVPIRNIPLPPLLRTFSARDVFDRVVLDRPFEDRELEGANLHVRSGSGATDERDAPTGLGNLIVGYNEDREVGLDRTGSHNLVVGPDHAYSSHGGLVAGIANKVGGLYATVTGGAENAAEGDFSAVSGGTSNTAEASLSAVGGGTLTSASSLAIWAAGDLSQGANGCNCPPCDGCSDAEKRFNDNNCAITCSGSGVVQ